MSYTFEHTYQLMGTGQLNLSSSTTLWLGLALQGTALAGNGVVSATDLSAISPLNECNYSGYSRTQLTGVSYSLDSTAHESKLTFDPVSLSLASSTNSPVAGAFIYNGSSSTGKPLFWMDTKPLFPFSGGGLRVLICPSRGAVTVGKG